ncbi:hypothetical protein GCM10009665_16170 [Kitasatospora nipponensis]|uniref:DJ-1/PfpI domain-containing protein n=1 Tax=Kitasatospora nipponensis TaxID=258049 RepID=A0ABN1VZB0_9ACTN
MRPRLVLVAHPDPVEPLDLLPVVRILEKCGEDAFAVRVRALDGPPGSGAAQPADVLLVPGGRGSERDYGQGPVARALDAHMGAGRPVYTVCSGAFVLAGRGLLTGRTVATHSAKSERLARLGGCTVRPGLVRDGTLTSVGGTAVGHVKALALALRIVADQTPERLPALLATLDVDPHLLPRLEVVR